MNEIQWGPQPEQESSALSTALLIFGGTFAAAVLILVFVLALLEPEEPAYAPDECTPEPDGFCATWHDYHENDWEWVR